MYRAALISMIALATLALAAQPAAEKVAGALVPLLKDARANRPSELTVEPGTAPPSPFTGRNSTLIAITIGERTIHLAPEVNETINRLIAWNVREPLPAGDREVVIDWIEELRIDVMGRLAAREKGVGCDDDCLVQHLTRPGPLFGNSREEQVETRNALLLEALIEAVKE
jgi:hypothetical protein